MMARKVIWDEEGPRGPASENTLPMVRRSALFVHEMNDLVITMDPVSGKLTVFVDPKFLDNKINWTSVPVPAELLSDAAEALTLQVKAKQLTDKADDLLARHKHCKDLFEPN
jgi:hypothetical protein